MGEEGQWSMNTPWLSAAALADAPHVTLANRGSRSIPEKKSAAVGPQTITQRQEEET